MAEHLVASLNRFFKANFSIPLFGAGGALLLMALSFAVNYYTHQADRIGQLVQARLAVSDRLREVEVADRLDKMFLQSFAAVERATRLFAEHLKNARSLPRLDAAVQEQGRSTSTLARGEVAYGLGVLDGTVFNDERLANFVAGFKRQLQDYDVQLAAMEGFFVALQAGDERRAAEMLQGADLGERHSEAIAAIVRSRSWGDLRLLTLREALAADAVADAVESDARRASYLAAASVGYSMSYLMMVAVYLVPRLRERRSGSSDTLAPPREDGGAPRPTE